jgi:NADPH-dependent 2,4-dienoyl-CoA reductase/sulfur reductase-like enzyme/Pyruvate/2-oxoacid:ferredoxin oxidoreductase delta subunit/bacterioferritin-associated ferredoxin
MVLANGLPMKACMELVAPGMRLEPVNGLPVLPKVSQRPAFDELLQLNVPVLIIGGGPAGLSAAIQLAKAGIRSLIVDDKHRLGGKLVLQTHRFFGSQEDVFAGTRGIHIATRLEEEVRSYTEVEIWLHSTALAVFSDKKVGILKDGCQYALVTPQVLLVAAGAREKSLAFRGNTLPGVYGAGAFQTLVNHELVRPAERLFIVGGGNVGLIAGYHALQAGIAVVGLVEALPECGGYKVHRDKLARMGVPIYTSHTILSANGTEEVESVTIARVDESFKPIPGSERSFECDTVLIAVGLDPVNEFTLKAREFGLPVAAAGDAEEIAEASAAILSGNIRGLEIARMLGAETGEVPEDWFHTGDILKSKPGGVYSETQPEELVGIVPIIHCSQEIPCNPCTKICPHGLIAIDPRDIRTLPVFLGDNYCCEYCERCVASCPGLAISLVNYRYSLDNALLTLPYEFLRGQIDVNEPVIALDTQGEVLGSFPVESMEPIAGFDSTLLVRIVVPKPLARKVAGIRIQPSEITASLDQYVPHLADDVIICRCERVSAGEIRALIRQGYGDLNEIKTISRAGMGACGSKTCGTLILRLFKEEGIPEARLTRMTHRPLFVEVPLGVFAGPGEEHPAPAVQSAAGVTSPAPGKNGRHD